MVDNPDVTILHKVDQYRNCNTFLEEKGAINYGIKKSLDILPITHFPHVFHQT
jgi:hypothetical protein